MSLQPIPFEEVLVSHAAPVLAGLKPSALLSFSRKQYPTLPGLVRRYARLLGGKGIALEIVCCCERHRLLFVYRPALLQERLREPEVRACLCRFGYPDSGFAPVMRRLRSRLREGDGFQRVQVGEFGTLDRLLEGLLRRGECTARLCALRSLPRRLSGSLPLGQERSRAAEASLRDRNTGRHTVLK